VDLGAWKANSRAEGWIQGHGRQTQGQRGGFRGMEGKFKGRAVDSGAWKANTRAEGWIQGHGRQIQGHEFKLIFFVLFYFLFYVTGHLYFICKLVVMCFY
jgi:hypothetical protein